MPALPLLDESLYPLLWQDKSFKSAQALIAVLLQNSDLTDASSAQSIAQAQQQFSQHLQHNAHYQDWVNFTVFGRYIQRSFSAFYRQNEDVFNSDMPELLRYELMRHTQRLPVGQVLLFGGVLPKSVRQEKLLIATVNPYQALQQALRSYSKAKATDPIIINLITAQSDKVKAFAIKHNKRTRDGRRNDVMILDFTQLVLVKEDAIKKNTQSDRQYLIRHYRIS
ncbi:hypothetical protein MN210_15590 [Psychrobacter raelei]|uniref:Uncharacterized protein n=1 Tax=Psychrobacter raelei TaxID=2565531 RepID=A0AAT9PDL0_9GAMM